MRLPSACYKLRWVPNCSGGYHCATSSQFRLSKGSCNLRNIMIWIKSCKPLPDYGACLSNLAREAIYMCQALLQMCSFCHMHAQHQLNLQPVTHKRNAAGLISMTTLLPEGRHVLAQRRMSGRVAKVFTSERSEYLQVGSVLCSYPTETIPAV